jgi:antitoxin YefM
MKTVSVSEAKMKLNGLIDSVNATGEKIMITKNGRLVAVLVSPEEFESLKETFAVRSNQTLMREIRRGLKSLQMKKAKAVTLEELFE